jgi:periplasmic protein TonB
MKRLDLTNNKSFGLSATIASGLIVSLLVFLFVPLLQMYEPEIVDLHVLDEVVEATLPPPPEQEEMPELEPEEARPPELNTPPPPKPTLEQLEVNLNPGLGDDFTIGVGLDLGFETESAEQLMDLFGFSDLDETPRIVRERSIVYPRNYRAIRGVANAKLLITVASDGSVQVDKVLECTHQELALAIVKMANGTRFSNPLKDGKPVRASYEWPLIVPLGR